MELVPVSFLFLIPRYNDILFAPYGLVIYLSAARRDLLIGEVITTSRHTVMRLWTRP